MTGVFWGVVVMAFERMCQCVHKPLAASDRFLRCAGDMSHNPGEFVDPWNVGAAAVVGGSCLCHHDFKPQVGSGFGSATGCAAWH